MSEMLLCNMNSSLGGNMSACLGPKFELHEIFKWKSTPVLLLAKNGLPPVVVPPSTAGPPAESEEQAGCDSPIWHMKHENYSTDRP